MQKGCQGLAYQSCMENYACALLTSLEVDSRVIVLLDLWRMQAMYTHSMLGIKAAAGGGERWPAAE
jgi:hypothetical protein